MPKTGPLAGGSEDTQVSCARDSQIGLACYTPILRTLIAWTGDCTFQARFARARDAGHVAAMPDELDRTAIKRGMDLFHVALIGFKAHFETRQRQKQ